MIRYVLLFGMLAALPTSGLFAQERGRLEVVEDPMISALQRLRAQHLIAGTGTNPSAVRERNPASRTVARGFRVQIYMGASRSEAYAEQARFQRLFSNIDTYVSYEAPNYRVKVGDFRSRSEADQLMRGLSQQFNNVFVHTEDIFVYH